MPPIDYFYDGAGRLIAVADMPGDTVFYSYDAMGNLLGIERAPSSTLAVIEFAPTSGTAGTAVTIRGTGFADTTAANRVEFAGVAAVVVSASPTQLVAMVPAAAATGPIAVTTPVGSAAGDAVFTVVAGAVAPTIGDFSPKIGPAGTTVVIDGTHLAATPADGHLRFNRTAGVLTSTSETQMIAQVPPGAASGRLSLSTPSGHGASEHDFFVPPASHTADDVRFTGRLAFGESATVAGTGTGLALVVFACAAGQEANVGLTGLDIGGAGLAVIEISILDPYGSLLTSGLFAEGGGDLATAVLRDSGDHTLLVDPLEAAVENLTLTLSQPVVRALAVDGPPLEIALRPGQNGRLTFEGTVGQQLGLGVGGGQFGPDGPSFRRSEVAVVRPNGATLVSRILSRNAMGMHLGPLPETGTYAIEVDAGEAELVSLTLVLSRSLTGDLLLDGPTRAVALRHGQDARFEFVVTAGVRVNLGITEAQFTGTAGGAVSIHHVDGTTLGSASIRRAGSKIATEPLAEPGTYLVVVNPENAVLDSLAITLTQPLAGTLDIDGPEFGLDLRPGQDARLLFDGGEGERARLAISDVSFDVDGAVAGGAVSVLRPDGTSLASTTLITGDSDIDVGPLPETGSYAVVVAPPAGFSVRLSLQLTRVA